MCDCIEKLAPKLAEMNSELVVNMFDPTYAFVEVVKKDSKKRGKPPYLAASYCPFCGEKYPKRATQSRKEI